MSDNKGNWLSSALVYGGAALLGAALYQSKRTAAAEQEHPPVGRFITADGTRLHYVDIGEGPPVVLLHGVGTTVEDWFISGVMDALYPHHRVIAFDRPGYGYSERPTGVVWTPEAQARTFAAALHRLGAHDAVIVGHSYGVLPAMALALHHSAMVRALVLLGGVYMPDEPVATLGAKVPSVPILGPLARLTVAPAMARATMGGIINTMFEPQAPTRAFQEHFPVGLVTRSSQLQASAADAAMIARATEHLSREYDRLDCPITVIAGSGDAIFDPDRQSRRFADAVPHARLVVVPAAGHMVHHSAPARVAAAIFDTFTGDVAEDDPGPPPNLKPAPVVGDASTEAPQRAGAASPSVTSEPADASTADEPRAEAGGDTAPSGGAAQKRGGSASGSGSGTAAASPGSSAGKASGAKGTAKSGSTRKRGASGSAKRSRSTGAAASKKNDAETDETA